LIQPWQVPWQGSIHWILFPLALAKLPRLTSYGPARSRLSLEIDKWLALNYWTPSHFATLTGVCCHPSKALIPREVARITSGSMFELMPKHFQAFARVEQLVRAQFGAIFKAANHEELLACFASSICMDDSSQQASWWFGLYCNEAWALAKIRDAQPQPSLELSVVGKLLPSVLRKAMAKDGLEMISYLRDVSQRIPASKRFGPKNFMDWVLEYERLDDDEVRLAMPCVLMLLSELGSDCKALSDVSVVGSF